MSCNQISKFLRGSSFLLMLDILKMNLKLTLVYCIQCFITVFLTILIGHFAWSDSPISYYQDIQPILQRSCQGCHQPSQADGDLILTSYEDLRRGGAVGAAFIAGQPDQSLILDLISGDPPSMPMGGDPLTPVEIEFFRRWIAEGAVNDTPNMDTDSAIAPPKYTVSPVISALAYSPDGDIIAVSGYREVLLHKSDGSQLLARLLGKSDRIESIIYVSDSKVLIIVGGTPAKFGEVQMWDTATNKLIHSLESTYDTIYGASLSPDNKFLAFGCTDKTARIVSILDKKEFLRFDNHSDWVLGTLFTTDGSHFVTGGRDTALKLTELKSGSFIDDINASNKGLGAIHAFARHPKLDQVLSGGADRIPRLYRIFRQKRRDVGNTDFNLIRAFERQSDVINAVAFSPDGSQIAVGAVGGEVRIYKVADGSLIMTLDADSTAVFTIAFHPNKNQVAIGGFDGQVRIFNLGSGELMGEFIPVPLDSALTRVKKVEEVGTVKAKDIIKATSEIKLVVSGMT